jgi:hypothetical protein
LEHPAQTQNAWKHDTTSSPHCFFALFVDILQFLLAMRKFSKITQFLAASRNFAASLLRGKTLLGCGLNWQRPSP